LELNAKLHGFEFKLPGVEREENAAPEKQRYIKEDLLFRDPKDYEGMTKEERQRLTKAMMEKFKFAATKTGMGT
jgi:hypothetical protein